MWLAIKRQFRRQKRQFRRHWILCSLIIVCALAAIGGVGHYIYVNNYDRLGSIFRTEDIWTYIPFGLASMGGFIISIMILLEQWKKEFGETTELLHHMIEILEDGLKNSSKVSILYPSPNPGQWNSLYRGEEGFNKYRKFIEECKERSDLELRICMLRGPANDTATPLGKFIKAFHDSTYRTRKNRPIPDECENRSYLECYQEKAYEFFTELESISSDYHLIDDSWVNEIMNKELLILAASHNLGFVGIMSMEYGKYRFKALEFPGSASFLHNLYDSLVQLYSQPVSKPGNESTNKSDEKL